MRILIISQHVFPIKTPRAHRTTELIKEFSKRNYEITVYSVLGSFDYSDFEIKYNVTIKNLPAIFEYYPYSSDGKGKRFLIDKILSKVLGKIFEFPYIEFLFSIPKIFLKEPKFDVIISIAEPHQIHWGCSRAKKLYPDKFPEMWIADTGDPFFDNGNSKAHFKYFEKFEKEFCSLSNYITIPVQEAVNGYFNEFRHKLKIIPQGFNFEYPVKAEQPKNEILTFAYAGMFYKDIRNPKMFFNFLITLNFDFKFIIYTPDSKLINEYKGVLKEKLIINKPIDRSLLIHELKNVDFLVNIENINSPNQIPSKLIDYALTGRPILSINPVGINYQIVNEFLNKNFINALKVDNIEQYYIGNVVNKFEELINH